MSKEADKVEDLLNEFGNGLIDNIVNDNTLVFTEQDAEAARKAKEAREQEIRERTLIAKDEANKIVQSAMELYGKNTEEIDYVQFKSKADAVSLGKIIYQIELTEDAITTIKETISDGDTNPALFKNFCELQKTLMELLKLKSQYVQTIESSFKQITTDVEMTSAVEVDGEEEENVNTAKVRGTRDLMKMIDNAKNDMDTKPLI